MRTGITDYSTYPLMPRGGVVQLMYRPGCYGLLAALASNQDNPVWEAECLSRPCLRLPFSEPPRAHSRPGCLTLTDGELTLEVRRCPELHSAHVTVTAPAAVELYCGPAGVLDRYGYTEGLDPSFYHAYPEEAVEGGCWVTHRNEWHGALTTDAGEVKQWGRGLVLALPAGRSVLGLGLGKRREEACARAGHVAAASAEQAEAYLEKVWEAVRARVPESFYSLPPAVLDKALEALYLHLVETRYEPYGAIHHAVPCAVVTGYRTPLGDWDSGLSAAALAPIDLEYAVGIVLDFLEHQHEDGSLPGGIEPSGPGGKTVVNKSLITAWAPWHIYQASGDPAVLEACLPALLRQGHYQQAWLATCPDGLPYDNSALNDNTPSDDPYNYYYSPGANFLTPPREPEEMRVCGGEISGSLLNQMVCLARLCRAARQDREADSFLASARAVAASTRRHLWDSQRRDVLYRYPDGLQWADNAERFLGALALPGEMRETTRQALRPGAPLWPHYGLATTGTDDPGFDPHQLWRGPIWIGTNYLVAEACAALGLAEVAESISTMTQELVARNRGFWECHNPQTGQGFRTQLTMGLNASSFLMFCQGRHRQPAWPGPEDLA